MYLPPPQHSAQEAEASWTLEGLPRDSKSQKCFRHYVHGFCSFVCRFPSVWPRESLMYMWHWSISQLKVPSTLQFSMVQLIVCLGTTSFILWWNKVDGKLEIKKSEVPCLAQFFSSTVLCKNVPKVSSEELSLKGIIFPMSDRGLISCPPSQEVPALCQPPINMLS